MRRHSGRTFEGCPSHVIYSTQSSPTTLRQNILNRTKISRNALFRNRVKEVKERGGKLKRVCLLVETFKEKKREKLSGLRLENESGCYRQQSEWAGQGHSSKLEMS